VSRSRATGRTAASGDRPVLTARDLNRATLARQMLLRREHVDVVAAIERLGALQAQWSPSPYIALWSRVRDFRREELWTAIERKHTVVRARLMRGTLHLVSSRDFYALAVASQDLQRGAWNRLQIGRGVDPSKVARLAVAYAKVPRAKQDVLAHLSKTVGSLGGQYGWLVWRFVSAHADLVAAPPSGHWDYGGTDYPYVAARSWIRNGSRPTEDAALRLLISRCVAAFGPVTLADVCQFAGQVPPRIRPVLERMAGKLVTFVDEQGRTYYDLPRAPRPDAETKAPLRFLPRWDEVLIAYQHRERIAPKRYLPAIYSKNGIIESSILIDGFVSGIWAPERTKTDAVIRVKPFTRLSPRDRASAEAEGEKLARFLAPEAKTVGVRFA
jgi:hypothetical protein